jgi:hypothetical protein
LQRATPQEHKFKARPLEISDEWRNEINSLYETLSRYAHPDGNKTGYKRLTPLPYPQFVQTSFDLCLSYLDQVIDHNAGLLKMCIRSKYWKRDLITQLLGKHYANDKRIEDELVDGLYRNINAEVVKKNIRAKEME